MPINRVIKVDDPFLSSIRNNLRSIFLNAINEKKRKLYNKRKILLLDNNGLRVPINNLDKDTLLLYKELGNKWWELERMLRKSILICSLCNSSKKNMIYNQERNEWFCEECNLKLIGSSSL